MAGDELPIWPSLEVVAYHVEKQLDLQWQQWDLLDGRLRLILGFAGAAFAAEIGFFSSGPDLSAAATILTVIATIGIVFAAVVSGVAFLPRTFERPPSPRHLREHYLVMSDADTKLEVTDAMIEAYEANARTMAEKAKSFSN